MKVVINKCYGGFGLSPLAVTKYAQRKNGGKPVYWYQQESKFPKPDIYTKLTLEQAQDSKRAFGPKAFSAEVPANPTKAELDEFWEKHYIDSRPEDRSDPDLIAVIEELGEERASGALAELKIVEIPDGVEYEIEEYDGIEWVSEVHRRWE